MGFAHYFGLGLDNLLSLVVPLPLKLIPLQSQPSDFSPQIKSGLCCWCSGSVQFLYAGKSKILFEKLQLSMKDMILFCKIKNGRCSISDYAHCHMLFQLPNTFVIVALPVPASRGALQACIILPVHAPFRQTPRAIAANVFGPLGAPSSVFGGFFFSSLWRT